LLISLVFYSGQIVLIGHENALLIIAQGFLHQFGKKCKMAGAKTSQMTDAGQSEIVTVEQMTRRPAGKSLAGVLLEKQIYPQIIEMNPKLARKAEKMGLSVFLGDAPHREVLLHAGIQKSAAVVVTVPDPHTCRDIIKNIRLTSPGTAVIARGRYHIAISRLKEAGANSVIDGENVVGHKMA
jgi:hypothetical protein